MPVIKQIQLSGGLYDIAAKYMLDGSGNEHSWSEVTAMASAAKLQLIVVDQLPTASEETLNAIYLIEDESGVSGTYVEWITLEKENGSTKSYAWERIGTTQADLSDYVKKGESYSGAVQSAGSHTHTVSGTVAVPTISSSAAKLSASVEVEERGSSTGTALTSLGDPSRSEVLGSGTSFSGSAPNAVVGSIGSASASPVTATNTVFGTDTQASKVSVTNGSAASFTQGSKASLNYQAAGEEDFFNSATVDENGILSFGTGSASVGASKITSWSANGDDSFTANVPTAVSASNVTVPVVTSNASVSASAVTITPIDVVKSIGTISVTAGDNDLIDAVTDYESPVESDFLTDVLAPSVEVTLVSGATGDVDYVGSITVGSANANLTNGEAASAGAHTHDLEVGE